MSLADLTRVSPVWIWITERIWRVEHAFEHAKAQRKEQDTTYRIFFVLVMFACGFGALGLGAIGKALLFDDGRGGGVSSAAVARADIVDRNGRLLAMDLVHYGAYLDPSQVWDKAETQRALTGALPGVSPERIARALASDRRTYLARGLTPEEKQKLHDLGLPGLDFEPEEHRVYVTGATASHLIGFTDSGGKGLSGAERGLEGLVTQNGAKGQPVALSIDLRVQGALEEELAAGAAKFNPHGAVGVVTDIHTGEILALASWPDFDPNKPSGADDNQKLNRAAASVFEMGSTFKAFTVAIGLDTKVATPSSTFDARQPLKMGYRTIHDYHGTNRILTLVEVFNHSSNIGTAKLAEAIGPARLAGYFKALGLTRPAAVELRESARPLAPKKWDEDDIASVSFGHGIDVSPLTLATAMGAVLNGGELIPLTIQKREPGYRPKGQRVISTETSETMLKIMRANVVGGTGRSADAPGLNVGGKTGTGEKFDPAIRRYSGYKQVASFASVFPTDGPIDAKRYFVLILMDEPQGGLRTGGIVSAPVAGRVIDRIAPFLGVPRRAPTPAPFALAKVDGAEH